MQRHQQAEKGNYSSSQLDNEHSDQLIHHIDFNIICSFRPTIFFMSWFQIKI